MGDIIRFKGSLRGRVWFSFDPYMEGSRCLACVIFSGNSLFLDLFLWFGYDGDFNHVFHLPGGNLK